MEQSTGWLSSRNSITARCCSFTLAVVVLMTWPSTSGVWQPGTSLGALEASTMHMRQLAAMDRRGW